jgi:hypothetical protein
MVLERVRRANIGYAERSYKKEKPAGTGRVFQ